jgi:protein MYSM1
MDMFQQRITIQQFEFLDLNVYSPFLPFEPNKNHLLILQAEEQGYYGVIEYDFNSSGQSDSDPDYGKGAKKKAKKKKTKTNADPASNEGGANTAPTDGEAAAAPHGVGDGDDGGVSLTGRRKRKDTGTQRIASRSWTDDEERLFFEALALHGRDWKKCGEHIGTRDHRAVASHAQKFLIKALLKGEELPGKMIDSGRGYTLSGKPLDPNSASARAYGLKPEAFQKVVDSGFLQVGVHVTTLELTEGPPPKREPKAPGSTTTGRSPASRKKSRKSSTDKYNDTNDDGVVQHGNYGDGDDNDDLAAALKASAAACAADAAAFAAAEPTEYAKNRPRRQLPSAKAQLGATTESLDLTLLSEFVGPIGAGAPLSQPFAVSMSPDALLVMDFHAHLSTCEVIGLLGGTFDATSKQLSIVAAYPCRRAQGSDSSTSVELDAESQVEVACAMEERGLIPVGWYHSHPVFEPRPSAKDNENQRNYQALCRDTTTGLEPWVGAIVGPYDQQLPTAASRTQLWVVRQQIRELAAFNIKHTRSAESATVPTPGSDVEAQLITALEQGKDDASRIDPGEVWRPYSRLVQGMAHGGPLTNGEKVQLAMRVHLPRDEAVAVSEFLKRLRGFFKEKWGVEVAEMVFNTTANAIGVAGTGAVDGKEEGKQQQQQQPEEEAVVAEGVEAEAKAAEASASPPGEVKAEQRDPNNGQHTAKQGQQKPENGAVKGVPAAVEAAAVPDEAN